VRSDARLGPLDPEVIPEGDGEAEVGVTVKGRALLQILALPVLLPLAAAAEPVQTPSIFAPSSSPAHQIQEFYSLVLGLCAAIFVIVAGLIVVAIVRFRERPGDDDREPPQVYGSNQLELAWTVVPIIIVFVLSLVTVRTIAAVQIDKRPEGWMEVVITGHQWWWELEYPGQGVVSANELHLPVSSADDPRPVFLTLRSGDVIHSFWIPQLAGKMDVIPNRENHLWLAPEKTGLFVGQCAEYCGTQHAHMLLRVYVHTRQDFERWVRDQREPASAPTPDVLSGSEIFQRTACINCHTARGTVASGRFGPDLTHLMSRDTLGAGAAPNDPENLRAWVLDPDHLKPGVNMPAMGVEGPELDALVAYLLTLE